MPDDVEPKRLRPRMGLVYAAVLPALKLLGPVLGDWDFLSELPWIFVLGVSAFSFLLGLVSDWLPPVG